MTTLPTSLAPHDARRRRANLQKVGFFTLLVNALAWLGYALGGTPAEPGLGLLVWGLAPIGSALLLRLVTRDWRDAGFRLAFKENIRWYLLSILLYPVVISTVVAFGWLTGIMSLEAFSWTSYLGALLPASVIYLVFAVFEEFGWRGYLAPKVARLRLNAFAGHVLVGLVWAAWHLPFISTFAGYTSEDLSGFVPRYFLGVIAYATVYGEIRLRTRSVWPAVLLHWVGNTLATPLMALVSFTSGGALLGSFGASGLGMTLVFGGLGFYLYRAKGAA